MFFYQNAMKRVLRLTALVSAVLLCLPLHGQYLDQYTHTVNHTPSVESFQMTRYGNQAPALYTGAMETSLDLFTYQDPDFTLPVSLEYHFEGYRPFQGSGTVGLGWALSCGGVITREIRGYEDERHEYLGNIEVLNDGTLHHVYTAGYYRYCTRDAECILVTHRIARRGSPQPVLNTDRGELYVFQNDFYNDIAIKEYVNPNLAGNAREWFDIEPDIFHFNFLGISGSFIFTETGVQVFNCSRPSFEITVTPQLQDLSPTGTGLTFEFIIDTGDGYRYVFGGEDGTYEHTKSFLYSHQGYQDYEYRTANPDEAYAAVNTYVTGWRLRKVIAPNGREMTFTYRDKADYCVTTDWTYTPQSWYALKGNYNTVQTQSFLKKTFHSTFSYPLESVSIRSASGVAREVISLAYSPVTEAENDCSEYCFVDQYAAQSFMTNQLGQKERVKLSSVTLMGFDGSVADNATLVQTSMGSTQGMRKMLLSQVTRQKYGTHSFLYAGSSSLPKHGSYYVDLWGFWDNSETDVRSLNISSGLLNVSLKNDVLDQKDDLNLSRTTTGGLSRITYPTGGYTQIAYEQNAASRLVERNGTAVPHLTDIQTSGSSWPGIPVGGVRVSMMMTFTGDGAYERVQYLYGYNSGISGILMNVPRYCHELQYVRYYHNASGSGTGQYVRCTGFNTAQSSTTDVFQSRIYGAGPSHIPYEGHIAYPEVTEILPDGSKNVYSFTNAGGNLLEDYYTYDSSYTNHDYCSDVAPPNQNEKTRTAYLTLSPTGIKTALRGKIKSVKTYSLAGKLVRSTDYTYDSFADLHMNCRHNMMTFWKEGTHDYYSSVPSGSTETSYHTLADGTTGQISRSTLKVFDYTTRQCRYERTSAGGETRTTHYRYCHETPGAAGMSPYPSAVADIAQTVGRGNEAVRVINRAHLTYSGNNPDPTAIIEYLSDEPPVQNADLWNTPYSSAWQTSFSYNSLFRPTRVNFHGGGYASFTWDSEGRYMTSRSVNGNDNTTSWTWKDQVGLLSVTHPTGQKETYGYDSAGRLALISDTYGSSVSRWTYAIGPSSGNSIRTQTYTSETGAYVTDMDFYNGLGYLSQSKAIRASGKGNTLVTHVEYDNMRRPDAKRYLPYATSDHSENAVTGAAAEQSAWYAGQFDAETAPFVSRSFENAGYASRVLSETRQGAAYRSAGKSNGLSYSMNDDEDDVLSIRYNGVSSGTGSVTISGYHPSGTLEKTVSVSEDGDTTFVFADALGRTVMTRSLDNGLRHDTYSIRDLRDSVVCVIQPEGAAQLPASGTVSFSSDLAQKHFFTWRYDARGNMTRSSVPGGGECFYGYDSRNRLISFMDATMRGPYISLQYQYDSYDRLAVEGYINPVLGSGMRPTRKCFYWGQTLPAGASDSELSFVSVTGVATSQDLDTLHCKNLIAYEALGEGLQMIQRYWYDKYGRVIQIAGKDYSTGISLRRSFRYDFRGNITVEYVYQHGQQNQVITLQTQNSYDSRGRLVGQSLNLAGGGSTYLTYSYDDLGNLTGRTINNGLLTETFSYNVQGFRTEAVTAGSICSDAQAVFSETSRYYDPVSAEATPRYGGDCSETHVDYAVMSADGLQTHSCTDIHSYDGIRRLIGMQRKSGNDILLSQTFGYDRNGNVMTLETSGISVGNDILSFTRSGNRTASASTSAGGFSGSYAYDLAGRMTTDGLRAHRYTYNLKGMTQSVCDSSGTALVTYAYHEDGTKKSESYPDGSGRLYYGPVEYTFSGGSLQNAHLDLVHFGDGVYRKNENGTWQILWFVRDQTGSVVSVLDITDPSKDISDEGVLVSQMGYSPYGTEIAGEGFAQDSTLRYRYAGKERQGMPQGYSGASAATGTSAYRRSIPNIINFGARMYDPLTSSWLTPDPLAHKYTSLSPYVYCAGNPVSFVDPDGKLYKKKIRGRSIIISAHYYVKRYDKESYRSVIIATDFWNKRKDTYISPSGIRYSVMYNLSVEVVDNLDTFQNHNTYQVVKSLDERPNASGASKHKRTIYVLESYSLFLPKTKKISTTGAHEIGHTLGMSHDYYGIMSESQDQHRTNEVTSKNIRQMLESGEGIQDILTSIINIISKVYEQKK